MRHKLVGFLFGEKGEKREIDGVRYQIYAEKTTAAVTRSLNATGDIVILSEVEGKNVTKIESNAFNHPPCCLPVVCLILVLSYN